MDITRHSAFCELIQPEWHVLDVSNVARALPSTCARVEGWKAALKWLTVTQSRDDRLPLQISALPPVLKAWGQCRVSSSCCSKKLSVPCWVSGRWEGAVQTELEPSPAAVSPPCSASWTLPCSLHLYLSSSGSWQSFLVRFFSKRCNAVWEEREMPQPARVAFLHVYSRNG